MKVRGVLIPATATYILAWHSSWIDSVDAVKLLSLAAFVIVGFTADKTGSAGRPEAEAVR